jgi:uncharacterized protein (TIGR03435 family)
VVRVSLVLIPLSSIVLRLACIIAVLGGLTTLSAQAPASPPLAFDVASIRENTSVSDNSRMTTAGRFTVVDTPLWFLILEAYGLKGHELIDAPDWTGTTMYDIVATYPPGTAPSDAERRLMMQQLLAERFQLRIRRERRDTDVYRLVLARGDGRLGPQLVRSGVDCEQWVAEKRPQVGAGGPSPVPGGRRPACMMSVSRQGFLTGGTRTMTELSLALQALAGRPVLDATGLTGTFDVDLVWAAASTDLARSPDAGSPVGGSLFTAVQEQLGLRLEPGRSPIDVVIVERVERPSPD